MTSDPDAPRRDPLIIVGYDDAWPALFALESARVTTVLQPWLVRPVEHIGSTSVPGLAAKPIVDMLAVVASLDAIVGVDFASIGWVISPQPDDDRVRRRSYCFPDPAWRTHHLHVVEPRSPGWTSWLAFRDYLRAHPEAAAAYGSLKTSLAAQYADDRAAYRAAKAPFIEDIIRRA